MTLNVRGPGGRFIGGGSLGVGEKFTVDIDITTMFDSTGIDQATMAMKEFDTIGQDSAKTTQIMTESNKEHAQRLREQIAPIRSVSWDLILMGRSMSILNTTFFGGNQILKDMTGIVYGVGAAMRILVTIQDLHAVSLLLQNSAIFASIGARIAHASAIWGEATAMSALWAVMGNPSGIIMMAAAAAVGAGITAAAIGRMKGYQQGGVIPATGPYILHKGETVIPSGTSMNIININMTTGGISSSVDVDRMLDAMALRMSQESRRRLGSGI